MHTDLEDFNTGWFGVSIGMKATEIDKLIKNLELLKEDENQHFHLSGDFDGEGGVGDISIISDVTFLSTVVLVPFLCSNAEQSYIQDIGFTSINIIDLCFGNLPGDQIFLNGVGMDAVVNFCQISFDIPAELFEFRVFKPLKFLDKIEFEFNRYP